MKRGKHKEREGAEPMRAAVLHGPGDVRFDERDAPKMFEQRMITAFGLTEPNHGSDATFMETRAVPLAREPARAPSVGSPTVDPASTAMAMADPLVPFRPRRSP